MADRYIECPELFQADDLDAAGRTLFLGGGISGCGDWQREMADRLSGTGLIVLNPRRANFDVSDASMTERQIAWEHHHLKLARARLFWFPPETLCPITLFELGKFCERADPLFVGAHPGYQRRVDVEIQLRMARPSDATVHRTLEELTAAVRAWASTI